MNDKPIIINDIDVSGCVAFKYDGIKKPLCRAGGITSVYKSCLCADNPNCYYKQLKAKERECFELTNAYHYLVKIANNRLDKIEYLQQQLDQLKAENDELKRRITEIFACLIKANKANKIVDTIWVDNIATLWDYIAMTLGIEGDQTQIEEQIL